MIDKLNKDTYEIKTKQHRQIQTDIQADSITRSRQIPKTDRFKDLTTREKLKTNLNTDPKRY